MTELELYGQKLLEAMQDKNPVMMLRRIRNNASAAIALAFANDYLTEAERFNTSLSVSNRVITTAVESSKIERSLSFMCLKKLAEMFKRTYAYRSGKLDEHCKTTEQLDKLSIQKLQILSKYMTEHIAPLMEALLRSSRRMNKQHVMREMLRELSKVG